jgi:hypothetical protein
MATKKVVTQKNGHTMAGIPISDEDYAAALDREQLSTTPENIELVYRLEEARHTLAKRHEF